MVTAPVVAPDLVAQFDARVAALFALLDETLRHGAPSVAEIDQLRTALHQVAGTAGLFGHADFGSVASELDDRLGDDGDSGALLRSGEARLRQCLTGAA